MKKDIPPLAGSAEAAEVLRVPVSTITRRRKGEKMPPLVADLAAGPVWLRSDVENLNGAPVKRRAHAERLATALRERVRQAVLLGTSEVAAMLDVDKSQIGRWRRRGQFPEPAAQIRSGPLWRERDVQRWKEARDAAAEAAAAEAAAKAAAAEAKAAKKAAAVAAAD